MQYVKKKRRSQNERKGQAPCWQVPCACHRATTRWLLAPLWVDGGGGRLLTTAGRRLDPWGSCCNVGQTSDSFCAVGRPSWPCSRLVRSPADVSAPCFMSWQTGGRRDFAEAAGETRHGCMWRAREQIPRLRLHRRFGYRISQQNSLHEPGHGTGAHWH